MMIFIQTAQQEKEGLVIGAIMIVVFIVLGIWVKIDQGIKNSRLKERLRNKSAITVKEINDARNYLDDDALADDLNKLYVKQQNEKKENELKAKTYELAKSLNSNIPITEYDITTARYTLNNDELAEKLRVKYNKQQDAKRDKVLKAQAIEFEFNQFKDADKELNIFINKLETETCRCNKCNSAYMRIWFLSDTLIELRCENCKKKFKYLQEDLDDIRLSSMTKLLSNNNERHNASYQNKFIRKSLVELDFNGHKANSPEWYCYTLSPKKEGVYGRKIINKESFRSRRISQEVKDAVWNRDGGKCVQCGSNENLEFDHIIPFSKGGANTYRNLQLLCESCNRSKSDKIG